MQKDICNVVETNQGLEIHLIEDLDQLHSILVNCDRWTEINNRFLCVRGGMIGIFAWVGEI